MAGGTKLGITAQLSLNWAFENYPDGAALGGGLDKLLRTFPPDAESDTYPTSLSSTSGNADQMWRDRRFVTSSTTTDDLDLAGSLTNAFGETVNLTTLRLIAIHNRSTVAGDDLLVGGAAANALSTLMNGSGASQLVVRASGILFLWAPLDGYAVTGGSDDTLRITHDGSSDAITYDMVLAGTE